MANKEQLEILEKGVEVWNSWREKNKHKKIDLSNANFFNAKLKNVNLSDVDLREANLMGADLSNANFSKAFLPKVNLENTNLTSSDFSYTNLKYAQFSEANLTKANFFHANLYYANCSFTNLNNANLSYARLLYIDFNNANLFQANFTEANLQYANFTCAHLVFTNFTKANLSFANLTKTILRNTEFTDCILGETIFNSTNLETIIGLDNIKVNQECFIDFQTLRNSRNIPKEFLLKIGLSENYINYLRDFYDQSPLKLFPVFLSHSWKNKGFAEKLYDALIKRGVQVWYDEKKLKAGDKVFEGITKAIDVYDKMILVCSKESLEESWWVDEEMNRIFKKERTYLKEKKKNVSLLIPITIDDHIFKWEGAKGESIRDKVIGDFSNWKDDANFEEALNKLIEALNVDREEDNITSFL